MTPEGCPSWIKRSAVSIIGVELRAACRPVAVIRSPRGSGSTCRLCWLSMLQCCGNSTLELITFSTIGRQHLAGRWPRRSGIGSSVCILRMPMRCDAGIYWQGHRLEGAQRGVGGVHRGACVFAADQTPHFHMKGLLRTQCIRQSSQIINNCLLFLDLRALLRQPCLSLTTKMFLSLDKYLPLIFPPLPQTLSLCTQLQRLLAVH